MILFLFFILNMLTVVSYIVLLVGALVFTLGIYLGLLKVVKLI
jgi:uncharacterized membrane protein YiaA